MEKNGRLPWWGVEEASTGVDGFDVAVIGFQSRGGG